MAERLYRLLLLLLLPRHRRLTYGDEMRDVFAALLSANARGGRWRRTGLWMREGVGMIRFAWRERAQSWKPSGVNELRWAWRGVRTRGWRAVFIVLLFGVALAANTVVFSAADAFVFRTVPYDRPNQLAVFVRATDFSAASDYTWPDAITEWRTHTDLFAGIQAHSRASSAYLTTNGVTEPVRAQRVTPGMFELLGELPIYGRPFVAADAEKNADAVAIISARLARQLFGTAAGAIGQSFSSGTDTTTVIGVMSARFRFPSAVEEIWRPMKLDDVPYNESVGHLARLQPGWTIDDAARAVAHRLPAVAAAVPEHSRRLVNFAIQEGQISLKGLKDFRRHDGATSIFAMLVGAAACLLLIACANVASLELAASSQRLRAVAVQTALGASRTSLIRVGLIEGALLLGASVMLAGTIAFLGLDVLSAQLTVGMREALANPLDLDPRVLVFMLVVAGAVWVLTILPSIVSISKLSVVDGLRHDSRTMPVSRGAARSRQWLMTTQVALTVLLLVGALLYIRTYETRIGLDKGLDARAVATLTVAQPPDGVMTPQDLERDLSTRLRALPGVVSLARTWSLPPSTQAGIAGRMRIAGRDGDLGTPMVSTYGVDPEYFATMGITLVEGRYFDATTPQEAVVIDHRFAQRYWPDGSALGARFSNGGRTAGVSEFLVVGVSRELRTDRTVTPGGSDVFVSYIRLSPTSTPLTFVVRLDDERRLRMLEEAARSVAPRLIVRVDTVEARYRRLEADTRLAAAISGGFGTLAWVVAAGGIYAVMAFLVAGRTREIGIRMALGADDRSVRRMVLTTSLRFVVAGTAAGLAGAALAYQWISAQLFGVTPIDPATYALVAGLVLVTAVAATWFPARRAARVDPAITLRAE